MPLEYLCCGILQIWYVKHARMQRIMPSKYLIYAIVRTLGHVYTVQRTVDRSALASMTTTKLPRPTVSNF